jgi:hypothetical protein
MIEFRLPINAQKIYIFKLNVRQYLVAIKKDITIDRYLLFELYYIFLILFRWLQFLYYEVDYSH